MNSQICSFAVSVVLGCAITLSTQAQQQQPDPFFEGKLQYSPEEEAVYLQRFNQAQNRSTAEEIYTPLEAMVGVKDWKPLPHSRPQQRTISEAALNDVSAYADRKSVV